MFDEHGKILSDEKPLNDIMWRIVVQAFKYSEKNTSSIHPEKSLHDYFAEKVKEEIPGGDDYERKREIIMQMSELWGGFVGSPITRQSLKFFWLEECVNGGESNNLLKLIEILSRSSLLFT